MKNRFFIKKKNKKKKQNSESKTFAQSALTSSQKLPHFSYQLDHNFTKQKEIMTESIINLLIESASQSFLTKTPPKPPDISLFPPFFNDVLGNILDIVLNRLKKRNQFFEKTTLNPDFFKRVTTDSPFLKLKTLLESDPIQQPPIPIPYSFAANEQLSPSLIKKVNQTIFNDQNIASSSQDIEFVNPHHQNQIQLQPPKKLFDPSNNENFSPDSQNSASQQDKDQLDSLQNSFQQLSISEIPDQQSSFLSQQSKFNHQIQPLFEQNQLDQYFNKAQSQFNNQKEEIQQFINQISPTQLYPQFDQGVIYHPLNLIQLLNNQFHLNQQEQDLLLLILFIPLVKFRDKIQKIYDDPFYQTSLTSLLYLHQLLSIQYPSTNLQQKQIIQVIIFQINSSSCKNNDVDSSLFSSLQRRYHNQLIDLIRYCSLTLQEYFTDRQEKFDTLEIESSSISPLNLNQLGQIPPEIREVQQVIYQSKPSQEQFQTLLMICKHFNSNLIIHSSSFQPDLLSIYDKSIIVKFKDKDLQIYHNFYQQSPVPTIDQLKCLTDPTISRTRKKDLLSNFLTQISPVNIPIILGMYKITYLLQPDKDKIQVILPIKWKEKFEDPH